MSKRGRHSARSTIGRDIGIMAIGVVVIGALVYGIAWGVATLFGGSPGETASPSTDTTLGFLTTSTSVATTQPTVPETTTTTATETTASTIAIRDPSEVVVLVLNSVGTPGLAANVTEELAELGYQTLEPDDYEPLLDRSQILFRDGYGPEAFELAAVVPDAEIGVNPDPSEADIVVLLGSSYDG